MSGGNKRESWKGIGIHGTRVNGDVLCVNGCCFACEVCVNVCGLND